MSDPTDLATEREELERERAIAAARNHAAETHYHGTECANACGELRAAPSRYCSAECRDEADRREGIRRRQGVR